MPREGTVDRIADGVAVVLIEEGGETVEEVQIDGSEIPDGVREGDRVRLRSDDGKSVDAVEGVKEDMERRMEKKLKRLRSRGRKSTERE